MTEPNTMTLRLRMKVWKDPATLKQYLMPVGILSGGGRMMAYAMTDEETKIIHLTVDVWNSLPFFYFKEDGLCLIRIRTSRPPDLVSLR